MPTITAPWAVWTRALADIAPAVSRRPTLPILSFAFVECFGSDVELTATDLELSIRRHFTLTDAVFGDSPFLLPVAATRDLLKAVATGIRPAEAGGVDVTISTGMAGELTVEGFGRALQMHDVTIPDIGDYPNPGRFDGLEVAMCEPRYLKTAVAHAATAAGRDDTLPMLTGVKFTLDPEQQLCELAGTDRYRLAVANPRGVNLSAKSEFLLPASSLKALAALPPYGKITVSTSGEGGNMVVIFAAEAVQVQLRAMEATFPPYQSLIPSDGRSYWEVDRAALVSDVLAAAAQCDRNAPLHVGMDEGGVTVSGCQRRDAVTTDVHAKWRTAFNPAYLLDGLRCFDSERVTIVGTSSTKPYVLRGGRTGLADSLYLIMPVRLPG